ncbi:unnamed protein product, partial [marine sediment metagenome]
SVDVVEIGDMKALPSNGVLPNQKRVRPLVAGISIGNWAITAGTLGWFFEKDGVLALGSNAHVLAEDPFRNPELAPREDRIVQPGKYDGGTLDDFVGSYLWHEPLWGGPSDCPISNLYTWIGNALARILGRRSRFSVTAEGENYIDFAVAKMHEDYKVEMLGANVRNFIGLGFAGSDMASYICKASRILETGWRPINTSTVLNPQIGATVHKVGRTSGYTHATILDDSVHGTVSYGGGKTVEFDDIMLTTKLLDPGDSGSSCWLTYEARKQ